MAGFEQELTRLQQEQTEATERSEIDVQSIELLLKLHYFRFLTIHAELTIYFVGLYQMGEV